MANIKTLKPFQKGHDPRRNTKGRPKGSMSSFSKILEQELKKKVTFMGQEVTVEEAIVIRIIAQARNGNTSAYRLLASYMYGKPTNYCPKCDNVVDASFKKEVSESNRRKELEAVEKEVDDWLKGWNKPAKK